MAYESFVLDPMTGVQEPLTTGELQENAYSQILDESIDEIELQKRQALAIISPVYSKEPSGSLLSRLLRMSEGAEEKAKSSVLDEPETAIAYAGLARAYDQLVDSIYFDVILGE